MSTMHPQKGQPLPRAPHPCWAKGFTTMTLCSFFRAIIAPHTCTCTGWRKTNSCPPWASEKCTSQSIQSKHPKTVIVQRSCHHPRHAENAVQSPRRIHQGIHLGHKSQTLQVSTGSRTVQPPKSVASVGMTPQIPVAQSSSPPTAVA